MKGVGWAKTNKLSTPSTGRGETKTKEKSLITKPAQPGKRKTTTTIKELKKKLKTKKGFINGEKKSRGRVGVDSHQTNLLNPPLDCPHQALKMPPQHGQTPRIQHQTALLLMTLLSTMMRPYARIPTTSRRPPSPTPPARRRRRITTRGVSLV